MEQLAVRLDRTRFGRKVPLLYSGMLERGFRKGIDGKGHLVLRPRGAEVLSEQAPAAQASPDRFRPDGGSDDDPAPHLVGPVGPPAQSRASTSRPKIVPSPSVGAASPNLGDPSEAATPTPTSTNGTGSSEWRLRIAGVAWSAVTASLVVAQSSPSTNGPKNDRSMSSTISRFLRASPSWPGSSGPLRWM